MELAAKFSSNYGVSSRRTLKLNHLKMSYLKILFTILKRNLFQSPSNFIFSQIEPDQVRHTAEILLKVVDAGLREVTLRLPKSLPDSFDLKGSEDAGVRAWRVPIRMTMPNP